MAKTQTGQLKLLLGLTDRFFLLKIILLFFSYFISARIGLTLDPVGGFATLVWPPTGIALAALLIFGKKLWPAILLAAFFANFIQGAPWHVAFGISVGNTLEALAAVYLLHKVAHFKNYFEELRDAWTFVIIAALGSTLISAIIGTASLYFGHVIAAESLFKTWLSWWVGDMLGNLIVAPFLLLWFDKKIFETDFKKTLETVIYISILCISSLIVFSPFLGINNTGLPINYIIYLPLIVIALRLSAREYSLAMVALSAIAIWGTSAGFGLYARGNLSESLFYLQLFMASTAATFLTLSVLMQEKRTFDSRKDEFLAIASHELKTPLTTIKAYIDLIKMKAPKKNTDIVLYASRVNDGVDRITNLVNDMLDLNKISTGKLEIKPERVLIDELIEKVVRDMRKTIHKNKIVLKCKTSEIVIADRNKITQVLINLIANAAKFSPTGGKILVTLTSNKQHVIIAVKDSGVGIDARHLKDVFKRFFQISTDHRLGKVGLGLGLYISSEIVKRHRGEIWVKSTLGRGSTFYVSLPKET